MKRLVLAVTFLLITVVNAQALLIVDVDYTDYVAERIDSCGYGCGTGSTGGYIGGPVSNNSLGGAFQFNVDKTTRISYLLASAHVSNYYEPQGTAEGMEFLFKLYTGTSNTYNGDPYPDVNTLALTAPMYVTTTTTGDGNYSDVPLPFKYTFKPGTYWIARERDYGQSGPIVDGISVEFAKGSLVNPEPSTIFLLGSGLFGAFYSRRKRS